jgi:glycosyltransferase involved in cell wall biosynthesis
MKIAIFGTYPPPIGGTSIHVKRLVDLLENFYDVTMYDTYGQSESTKSNVKSIDNYKKFLLSYLLKGDEDIIHSHTHSWNERAILTFIAIIKRRKIIFTYHSFRYEYPKLNSFDKLLIKFVFKFSSMHIVANHSTKIELKNWGLEEDKIKVIPTFLLPRNDKEEALDSVNDFRNKFKYIISANASNNDFYKNEDLYGIDMCIDLCSRLSEKYDVGFIFSITKISNEIYFNQLLDRINELNINERFMIINKNISLIPVLKTSDVFIRPTNTDSFGISVGEAISLGKPTIASDVCDRLDGTILFKSRDIEDLYGKTCSVLDNLGYYTEKVKKIEVIDNSEELLNIYKNFDLENR